MDVDDSSKLGKNHIDPWSMSTIMDLLKKINCQLLKFDGYHTSHGEHLGKVALSSLQKSSKNRIIETGGIKYQIKDCAGQGGFAQVFKAFVDTNPDEVLALKIQKPPFPWEFYMYRLLDIRITDKERASYGFAHRLHLYSDYSILVCNYLCHGTLQMLCMMESLHSVDIIHGDFKPDNLLVRYARDDLSEVGFRDRIGAWQDQGLSLVDWGRVIDLRLFPDDTEFNGDCKTSCFRCIEIQEHKPWKFQVDTYGLCVIVHMMLHNSYMEIEKKASYDGGFVYQPKNPFKRYWKGELWKNLFTKLLNSSPGDDHLKLLQSLRISFQNYMCSSPHLIKNLKQLLVN